jgi:hypothetical protein
MVALKFCSPESGGRQVSRSVVNFGSRDKLRYMALHFPAGTTYRVVLRRDRTYGVEVSKPKATPFIVNGFRTEVEADGWIKIQRLRTKEPDG